MKNSRSAYLLEKLEPRLLFSADLAMLPIDGGALAVDQDVLLMAPSQLGSDSDQVAETVEQVQREVIFIDAGIDDYRQLLDDIQDQAEEGRQFETVLLDSNQDGITQISDYLNSQQDISAVHIISHGSNGEVVLGNSPLNLATLDTYAEAIEGWQQSLTEEADLLFYGCNLASGAEGQTLISSLALLTGADVAASDDATGQAALGGDWELEYKTGVVEATCLAANSISNWDGLLATFTVNTTADTVDVATGDGNAADAGGFTSLRAAIMEANALAGADVIILPAGTYTFTLTGTDEDSAVTGDLDIEDDLTITGAGLNVTIIDADGLDRVFHVQNSSIVTISDVTIQGGDASSVLSEDGGGLLIDSSSDVSITNTVFTGNNARAGGAIASSGTFSLVDVTIDNNTSTQGAAGIATTGVATLERVTVSNNTTSGTAGGGIEVGNGSFTATNVTISGNSSVLNGGGIFTLRPITLINTTITNNTSGSGGGVEAQGAGSIDITNTIIAGNNGGDVAGSFISSGNNLIGDGGSTGLTDGVNGDQVGTSGSPIDPLLGTLQDNGGTTITHALLPGSTATNAGTTTGAPATDQRGVTRDATPDIGAYEYTPPITTSISSVQDTYLNDNEQTFNYGISTSIIVDQAGGELGDGRALLQFDLGSLPAGAIITSATLELNATSNTGAFDNNVFKIIESWVEGSGDGTADVADWDERLPGVNWTDPGALLTTAPIVATLNTSATGQHTWDVTTLAQDWISAPATNYGLMLASPDTGTEVVTYDSREGTTPPKLVITYTVPSTNTVPVAVADSFTVNEGSTTNLDLAGNDTDADGNLDLTSIVIVSGPSNGSIDTIYADGTVDYTHDGSETLTDSFTYTINDLAAATSNTVTVSMTITPINDAPTLANNSLVINEGESLVLDNTMLSATDIDDDDSTLEFHVSAWTNGQFERVSTGMVLSVFTQADIDANDIRFVHDGGENAPSYNVYVTDGADNSPAVPANIAFNSLNDQPILTTNEPLNVPEESTRTITSAYLAVSDVDNPPDEIVYTMTGLPSSGSVRLLGSSLGLGGTFTQADIDNGDVAYRDNDEGESTSFQFTFSDGTYTSGTITFSINGAPINDAPVVIAPGSALSATEQMGLEIAGTGFTVSDVDAGSSALLVTIDVGEGNITIFVGDSGVLLTGGNGTGTVTFTGSIVQINSLLSGSSTGTITYLNGLDSPSPSTVLTVTVNDQGNSGSDPGMSGDASSEEGTDSVVINITAVNDAPVLNPIGNRSVDELTALTFTATATDADLPTNNLSYSLDAASVTAGMSIDSGTGAFSWTPTEAQDGSHSVTVTVTDDGTGTLSASETFNVTVNEINVNPVLDLIGDQSVDEQAPLTFTATATDADLPGNGLSYSLDGASVTAGMGIDAGTGVFSWTPTEAQDGSHSVTVTVTDDGTGALTDSETFNISVAEINVAPVLGAIGNQTVDELNTLSFTATATDADLPANNLSYGLDATSLAAGMTINSSTGAFSWTPTEVQDGVHSVTVTVTDDGTGLLSYSEPFSITVNEVNVAPTGINLDNLNIAENSAGAIVGNLSTSDPDVGDSHSYTVDDGRFEVIAGQLKLIAGQSLDHETEATVDVTVTSTDIGGLSTNQLFTLTVNDLNDAPITINDNLAATEDTVLNFGSFATLIANDTDAEGGALSLSGFTQPGNGLLVDNADGTLSYTPGNNFYGTDSFNYTVSDGNGGFADGLALIVVTPVGDTPRVENSSVISGGMSPLIIINCNPADGAEVSHLRISAISGGTLYLSNGVSQVNDGDYITPAQGQAGVLFAASDETATSGSFNVESSEDGSTVAAQSGVATSTVTIFPAAAVVIPELPETPIVEPEPETTLDEELPAEETETVEEIAAEVLAPPEQSVPIQSEAKEATTVSNQTKHFFSPRSTNDFFRDSGDRDGRQATEPESSAAKLLKVLLEKTDLGSLQTTWDSLDIDSLSSVGYEQMRNTLDAIQEELGQEVRIEKAVIGSAIATSVGLSAGYVVWMLKGGSLLASVLSSMPAWHLADPLSILVGRSDDEDDDESLETIIENSKANDKDSDSAQPEPSNDAG